jgi:hypothetical protein
VKWTTAALATLVVLNATGAALGESCTRSRDFILTNASDLPQKSQVYLELFRNCLDTLQLSNVQDAFVLKAGAIAVLPRVDTVSATAGTLAQFCQRFPRGTLNFIARKDRAQITNMGRAVNLSFPNPTTCKQIRGDE